MTSVSKFISGILCCTLLLCSYGCHKGAGHNEYLEAKERVSERQMRQDKKIMARGNRNYKKQMRKNRKHLFGKPVAPKA